MPVFRLAFSLLALATVVGCGVVTEAHLETAKANLRGKIDDALGKLEVRRQEIILGLEKSEKALAALREARITSEVRVNLLGKKIAPIQDKADQADGALERIASALQSESRTLEVSAGQTLDEARLEKAGREILQLRKENLDRASQYTKARETLRASADALGAREKEVQKAIEGMKESMQVVDAQMAAAKEVEKASLALGGNGRSLEGVLEGLEEKIAMLGAEVESRLGIAAASQQMAAGSTRTSKDADLLLASGPSAGMASVLADIESIRKAKNGGKGK